ncbi:hypothetical protein [Mycobacterium sp. NPDC006124]|uniref:hypothetical protein n=1 Tax=Mycobacterium sp. NPDC006124 TaxID=3156729 RepID=UPI0033A0FE7C
MITGTTVITVGVTADGRTDPADRRRRHPVGRVHLRRPRAGNRARCPHPRRGNNRHRRHPWAPPPPPPPPWQQDAPVIWDQGQNSWGFWLGPIWIPL